MTKMAPQIDQKSMENRGCVADAFWGRFLAAQGGARDLSVNPFWRPFSTKSLKNWHPKSIEKSMQKKYRKCMPEGSQNDAKMDSKSIVFSYFVEKGQNALDPLFSHIIRGSRH